MAPRDNFHGSLAGLSFSSPSYMEFSQRGLGHCANSVPAAVNFHCRLDVIVPGKLLHLPGTIFASE
jgi:hypothetical protein